MDVSVVMAAVAGRQGGADLPLLVPSIRRAVQDDPPEV